MSQPPPPALLPQTPTSAQRLWAADRHPRPTMPITVPDPSQRAAGATRGAQTENLLRWPCSPPLPPRRTGFPAPREDVPVGVGWGRRQRKS